MTGLRRRGRRTLWPREPHNIFDGSSASSTGPQRAPTMECVVETGIPILVARSTHPEIPAATAIEKWVVKGRSSERIPLLKTLSRPVAIRRAVKPPATVQSVPHRSALLVLQRPLPWRVAIPFETSFAPLKNATDKTKSNRTRTIRDFYQTPSFTSKGY